MKFSRRDCLRLGLVGGAAGALGGCARIANRLADRDSAPPLPGGNVDPTTRWVNRLSFGPRPGDIAAVQSKGRDAYVEEQLHPDGSEDLRLQFLLNQLDVFQMDPYETQDLPEREVIRQLQASAILRATYGHHQLQERMVDFWTNHFNIYGRKGLSAYRKAADETNVVRRHALGSFPELLTASAHSPAMLMYLDNQSNISGRPNENYAREIMELHTMGVNSGYTQRDVQEVARCFTGWTIERRLLHHRWAFRFDPETHDNGAKDVLGHHLPAGGGEKDADAVLSILAGHPATAHHISKKLCEYFLGADGSRWVDRTAATFLATNGDIRAMLRPILLSPELESSPPILKRPFDFMISSLRALRVATDGSTGIQTHLDKMGEPLYQWPMPDGYPTRTTAWTGTMLPRWNFAYALASDEISGTSIDWDSLSISSAENLFELTHATRPHEDHKRLLAAAQAEMVGPGTGHVGAGFLCLAAPSFQWR